MVRESVPALVFLLARAAADRHRLRPAPACEAGIAARRDATRPRPLDRRAARLGYAPAVARNRRIDRAAGARRQLAPAAGLFRRARAAARRPPGAAPPGHSALGFGRAHHGLLRRGAGPLAARGAPMT